MTEPRVFPLEPVLAQIPASRRSLRYEVLKCSGQRWRQMREEGLTAYELDRLAAWFGAHPSELVGDAWWDAELDALFAEIGKGVA